MSDWIVCGDLFDTVHYRHPLRTIVQAETPQEAILRLKRASQELGLTLCAPSVSGPCQTPARFPFGTRVVSATGVGCRVLADCGSSVIVDWVNGGIHESATVPRETLLPLNELHEAALRDRAAMTWQHHETDPDDQRFHPLAP